MLTHERCLARECRWWLQESSSVSAAACPTLQASRRFRRTMIYAIPARVVGCVCKIMATKMMSSKHISSGNCFTSVFSRDPVSENGYVRFQCSSNLRRPLEIATGVFFPTPIRPVVRGNHIFQHDTVVICSGVDDRRLSQTTE